MKFPATSAFDGRLRSASPQFQRVGSSFPTLRGATALAGPAADRTRWQLLFALGSSEQVCESVAIEGGFSVKTVDKPFTAERLQGMVERFAEYQAKCDAFGGGFKPLPVSMHHAIEARVFGGWCDGGHEALERAGSVYALHLNLDSDSGVPGLYGLIEYTPRAWGNIVDGVVMDASPTTIDGWKFADGSELEGEFLCAVGLVDWGFLENIGTLRSGLPADRFSASEYVTLEPAAVDTALRSARVSAQNTHSMVMRSVLAAHNQGASMAAKLRNSEPAVTGTPATAEPALRSEGDAAIEALVDAKLAPLAEKIDTLVAIIEALKAAEEVEAKEGEPVAEVAPIEEVAYEAEVARSVVAAKRAADKVALTRATELAGSGKLLASHVSEFVALMRAGKVETAMALTGDYGTPAPSGSAMAAPVKGSGHVAGSSVSESAVWDEVAMRATGKPFADLAGSQRGKLFPLFKARSQELRTAGVTITNHLSH